MAETVGSPWRSVALSSTADRDAKRAELFKEFAETGSVEIRNALVESYAPLVEYFAGRYRNRGVPEEDLRQVAQLACVKAVDRFDLGFGVQFSTFAGRTIEGELKRYFRDKTWAVRVPRSLQELGLELRSLIESLSTEHGRAPTVPELVAASGHSEEEVLEALDAQTAYRATSIDQPVRRDEEGGGTLAASIGSEEPGYDQTDVAIAVRTLLDTLPERERRIIELRFFADRTQQQIADEMGISQMHVSRLLRRSLTQLRAYFPAN